MTLPLVSVIVPCYNYGNYIQETLQSVLSSTYKPIEIIVVNDGSIDTNTKKVLGSIRHKNITVIHQDNQGLASARNNGIRRSRGKYFLPLDADDCIDSTYIEKAVNILESSATIGFVYPYIQYFGDVQGIGVTGTATLSSMRFYNSAVVSSVIRRKAYNQTIGYNQNMIYGYEDWDFYISLLERNWQSFVIPEPLFFYRKHGKTMIHNALQKHAYLYSRIKKNHPHLFTRPSYILLYPLYKSYRLLLRPFITKRFRAQMKKFAANKLS